MKLTNNTPSIFTKFQNQALSVPGVEDGNTPDGSKQGKIFTSQLSQDDGYDYNYKAPIAYAKLANTTTGQSYCSNITVNYDVTFSGSPYATNPGLYGSDLIKENDAFTITNPNKDYVRGIITKVQNISYNENNTLQEGSVDTTLNIGTGFDGPVQIIKEDANGKLLVGGSFYNYNGNLSRLIIRLNYDGTVDNTFTSYFPGGAVYTIDFQPDGKILVGGLFSTYDGYTNWSIVRLNPNGTKDLSFNVGTGFTNLPPYDTQPGQIFKIHVLSSGKIMVGGSFEVYDGNTIRGLCRLNIDGSFDATFNAGNPGFSLATGATPFDILELPDNKILVGGTWLEDYNSVTVSKNLIRLNTDGTNDTTFNTGGIGFDWEVKRVLLHDNKLLVGGFFSNYNGVMYKRLMRLTYDGDIDTSFNTEIIQGNVFDMAIQPDGKIIVADRTEITVNTNLVSLPRFYPNGVQDTSFKQFLSNPYAGQVESICLLSNGKAFLGGTFIFTEVNTYRRLARIIWKNEPVTYTYDLLCTINQGDPLTIDTTDTFQWNRQIYQDKSTFNNAYPAENLTSSVNKSSITLTADSSSGSNVLTDCSVLPDAINGTVIGNGVPSGTVVTYIDTLNNEITLSNNVSITRDNAQFTIVTLNELYFYWNDINEESSQYTLKLRNALTSLIPTNYFIKVLGKNANSAASLIPYATGDISTIKIVDQGEGLNNNRKINFIGKGSGAVWATRLDNEGKLLINEFTIYNIIPDGYRVYVYAEKTRPEYNGYPIANLYSYVEGLPQIGSTTNFYISNVIPIDDRTFAIDIFDAETGLPITIDYPLYNTLINTKLRTHDGVYKLSSGTGYDSKTRANLRVIPNNVRAYVDLSLENIYPDAQSYWAWSLSSIYNKTKKLYTEWTAEEYIHF